MNGMYILKSIKGTRYEFYWAPVDPELTFPEPSKEELDTKWGLAVIDVSWITEDPRPKHLRAKPLGYDLHQPIEVLSYPVLGGKPYLDAYNPLKHSQNFIFKIVADGLYQKDGKKRDRYWWASG